MTPYQFFTCDVFTHTRFGGNPLAVFPEASGLSEAQMQAIAREFNYSETTFVFPPDAGGTRRVRIFTPTTEVPFAGHPNIGTAFVLAKTGTFGEIGGGHQVVFEEKAGEVAIRIEPRPNGRVWCELQAPQPLYRGKTLPPEALSLILGLTAEEIATEHHLPQVASVGLPFLIAELRDRAALERIRVRVDALEGLVEAGLPPDIHVYVRSGDDYDLRTRMFAPLDNVPEDPATGSANCALVGLLTALNGEENGRYSWRIGQGIEMGRPSLLEARTEKVEGEVSGIWIGGACVMVSQGHMRL